MALNPKLKPGDRIVCYYMDGDTISVPIGTTGTVKKIVRVPFGLGFQYSVKWDNGSTLDLIPDSDAWDFEDENVLSETKIGKKKKVKVFSELSEHKRLDLLNEVDNLNKFFNRDVLYSNIEVNEWDIIKNFLDDLRNSGIVNMWASPPYLYAPWEWIQDQTKWLDLSDEQEDAIERLKSSHEEARNTLINITLRSFNNKDFEMNQFNRKLQKLATMVVSELFEHW
jgi:primosomal protein N'